MRADVAAILNDRMKALNKPYVAWPNFPFRLPTGQVWYRPRLLGGPIERPTMGSPLRRQIGNYQVSVFGPAATQAPAQRGDHLVNEAVDEIIAYFEGFAGTHGLVTLTVQEASDGPATEDVEGYGVPVTLRYRAHQQPGG